MIQIPAVTWSSDRRMLRYLDQRLLPSQEVFCDVGTIEEVITAIQTLAIRGAPAIGVGAAMGLAAALNTVTAERGDAMRSLLPEFARRLAGARPTAVNLAWAVDRMVARAAREPDERLGRALFDEAELIRSEDVAMCHAIGQHGLKLITHGARILTHCNAGALATAGIGTALAPIYAAHATGKSLTVFATETRPLRQGARLTAWELQRAGIPVTLLPDSAAASLLRDGQLDMVIVGADRIAANGDVANKIGTYALALAAHAHDVPFIVAAPCSTIDATTATGAHMIIELRHRDELGETAHGIDVWNPAFDVTPRRLVTSFLTDRGLVSPPFNLD